MFGMMGRNAALAAAAVFFAVPAAAQTTTFDFRSTGNSALFGSSGNSATFWNNDHTISVIATAWSLSTPNGTPSAAYLGRYVNGLGVTNGNEGTGTTDNSHTIDNVGSYDFVTLAFSSQVKLLWGSLVPFDVTSGPVGADNDVSVSYANATDPALWTQLKLHTTEQPGNLSASQSYQTSLNPGMNIGNIWTIGADRLLQTAPGRDDGFKLAGIAVQAVPEPATWAMMILGFGVMGGSIRRQRTRTSRPAIA